MWIAILDRCWIIAATCQQSKLSCVFAALNTPHSSWRQMWWITESEPSWSDWWTGCFRKRFSSVCPPKNYHYVIWINLSQMTQQYLILLSQIRLENIQSINVLLKLSCRGNLTNVEMLSRTVVPGLAAFLYGCNTTYIVDLHEMRRWYNTYVDMFIWYI